MRPIEQGGWSEWWHSGGYRVQSGGASDEPQTALVNPSNSGRVYEVYSAVIDLMATANASVAVAVLDRVIESLLSGGTVFRPPGRLDGGGPTATIRARAGADGAGTTITIASGGRSARRLSTRGTIYVATAIGALQVAHIELLVQPAILSPGEGLLIGTISAGSTDYISTAFVWRERALDDGGR